MQVGRRARDRGQIVCDVCGHMLSATNPSNMCYCHWDGVKDEEPEPWESLELCLWQTGKRDRGDVDDWRWWWDGEWSVRRNSTRTMVEYEKYPQLRKGEGG